MASQETTQPNLLPAGLAPPTSTVAARPTAKDLRAVAMRTPGPIWRDGSGSEWKPVTNASGAARPVRLGRYWLYREIASGGMGTVYLARQETNRPGYDRIVALKRIHDHLSERVAFRKMFLDEVHITSRLDHPNAISVLDFGEDDDILWYSMGFVLGEPWSRVVSRARARDAEATHLRLPSLAARCLIDACEGLHAAHELRGDDGELLHVVHRDVSPQNLLVGADGVVRVVDYGVARAVSRLQETRAGQFKGKLSYAAPEQIEGRKEKIDRRADVWSLGVVLWESLTGRPLFTAKMPMDMMHAILRGPIPGVREIDPSLPFGLDEIVSKALQRDPERRFRTAREMGRELSLFLADEGISAEAADVAEWVEELFAEELAERRAVISEVRRDVLPEKSDRPSLSSVSQSKPELAPVEASPADIARVIGEGPSPDLTDVKTQQFQLEKRRISKIPTAKVRASSARQKSVKKRRALSPFDPVYPTGKIAAVHANDPTSPSEFRRIVKAERRKAVLVVLLLLLTVAGALFALRHFSII